ncbi:hypothetical protein Salat_2730600 [Sesamum alatum]|uniref:Uncharacterized protein n=1 Tax=Sesamum alatum TaxID=300844 RepID=A0AAE2C8S1_9LAMI|nr:hypothetical protein Salat_2730600 [Sesamum alatum]
MEVGGLMKNKLIMSFYRAAKPSPVVQCTTTTTTTTTTTATTTVEKRPKPSKNKEGGFRGSDGYVHGRDGSGGDEHVDNKATNYISYVKERLRLEEANLLKENNCNT